MDKYLFENNQIKFYRYKANLNGKDYLFTDKNSLDIFLNRYKLKKFEEIYLSDIANIIDGLKTTNNCIAIVLDESSIIESKVRVDELQKLLDSNGWKYGRWKLDKISEYALNNLECPYSPEELSDLHNAREKIRELIRYYQD